MGCHDKGSRRWLAWPPLCALSPPPRHAVQALSAQVPVTQVIAVGATALGRRMPLLGFAPPVDHVGMMAVEHAAIVSGCTMTPQCIKCTTATAKVDTVEPLARAVANRTAMQRRVQR